MDSLINCINSLNLDSMIVLWPRERTAIYNKLCGEESKIDKVKCVKLFKKNLITYLGRNTLWAE